MAISIPAAAVVNAAGNADPRRDLSPQDRSERHAAHEHHHECREAAGAHPVGQGQLRTNIPAREQQNREGQRKAPQQRAPRLLNTVAFGRRAVQVGAFGEGVSSTLRTLAPLAESKQRSVVQRHFGMQPPDAPAGLPQAHAQLRFLARDQVVSVAADSAQRVDAHHHVAAAGADLADRRIPLDVAKAVVNGSFREALPAYAFTY
jgi:hypothetical protein